MIRSISGCNNDKYDENVEIAEIIDLEETNNPEILTIIHRGFYCNGCEDDEYIKGYRLKCKKCLNYNLCKECYGMRSEFHYADHKFQIIKEPELTFQEQIEKLKKEKKVFKNDKDEYHYGVCCFRIGKVFLKMEDLKKAIKFFQDCLESFRKLKKLNELLTALSFLGDSLRKVKKEEKALEYYLEALNIVKKMENPDKNNEGQMQNVIASLYLKLDQPKKALTYFLNSYKIMKEYKADNIDKEHALINIGLIYQILGDYNNSLKFYSESLNVIKKMKFKPFDEANVLKDMAMIYDKMNNHKESINYYQKALKVVRKFDDTDTEIAITEELAKVSYKMKNFKNVVKFYNNCLKIIRDVENIEKENQIVEELKKVYIQIEKPDLAKKCKAILNEKTDL